MPTDALDRFSENTVTNMAADTLRPIVTITAVSGFPQNVTVETEEDSEKVTLAITDRLQKFELVDNDRKIDACEVTFLDEEGFFTDPNQLKYGAVVDVAWGYPGLMSQPRRLWIRRIKLGMLQGRKFARRRRGYLVTFHALAPGVIDHGEVPTTDDVFESKPFSSIVRIISQKLGYHTESRNKKAIIKIPVDTDTVRENITRAATETYDQFLSRIANEYGFIYKRGDDKLYFGERDLEDKASFVVDAEDSNLLGFDLDGDLIFGVPAGLTVVGFRPKDQKIVQVDISNDQLQHKKGALPPIAHTSAEAASSAAPESNDGQVEEPRDKGTTESTFRLETNGTSKLQAISKSHTVLRDYRPATDSKIIAVRSKHYNQRIKKTWRLRLRLVGTVDIVSGELIVLINFSTALLEGVWYVKEARHTIDQNGYITELVCRRQTSKSNGKAGVDKIVKADATVAGKKGETEVKETEFILTGKPIPTKNTGGRKKTHDTDGDFFPTNTRRGK
jgi:phage protein D